MESGTPVEQIADILGHQSVESTGVYLKSSLGLLAKLSLNPWGLLRLPDASTLPYPGGVFNQFQRRSFPPHYGPSAVPPLGGHSDASPSGLRRTPHVHDLPCGPDTRCDGQGPVAPPTSQR